MTSSLAISLNLLSISLVSTYFFFGLGSTGIPWFEIALRVDIRGGRDTESGFSTRFLGFFESYGRLIRSRTLSRNQMCVF